MAALVLPTPGVAAAEPDSKTPRSLNEIVARSADTRPKLAAAADQNTLFALTPSRDAVLMFDGVSWSQIGGPAAQIYAGGGNVYATSPTTGDLSWYDHATATWLRISGPFDQIAVDDAGIVAGLNSTGIFEWWGGDEWRKLGGPASSITYGGIGLLVATSITTGEPSLYSGLPFQPWTPIGGPGKEFVITTPGYFYGKNSDGVYAWRGGLNWIKVGGPVTKMYTGAYMVATRPAKNAPYRFHDTEFRWERVGDPGDLFAVSNNGTLYGLNSKGIWRMDAENCRWTRVGDPAATFAL
ncbi:hypothetical protein [Amycolatopsis magusensis]|uniref:hypothetical protein n=1 Tax=Amycolatopsis magusensis TaxID=882444 RepID=UPI0037BA8704